MDKFYGSNLKVSEYLITPFQQLYVIGNVRQKAGKKSIAGGKNASLILCDQDKSKVITTLFKRVLFNLLLSVIAGAVFILLESIVLAGKAF